MKEKIQYFRLTACVIYTYVLVKKRKKAALKWFDDNNRKGQEVKAKKNVGLLLKEIL